MASPIAATSSSAFSRVARACSIRSCATRRNSCSSTVPLMRLLVSTIPEGPDGGHLLMRRLVRAFLKPQVGGLFGHGYHVQREHHGRGDRGRSARPVLGLLDASVPNRRAEALKAFAVAFTRRLPPQDLAERPAEELVGVIVGAFELADTAGGRVRRPCVRAGPPEDGYEAPGTVVEVSAADSPFLYDSVTEELDAWGWTPGA